MLDRRIEEYGNFCSAPCANTYLDKNMRDSNLSTRVADLFEYMQDIHGFRGNDIGFAPHFTQHINYGGDLSDEQFDAIIGTPSLTTHILMKPYIPTDAVIEWQFSGEVSACLPPAERAVAAAGSSSSTSSPTQEETTGDFLASIMRVKAPEVDHHHRWDATHLRQPPMEEIEERLAGLPQLAKTTGLYELYLSRKGGFDTPISDDEEPVGAASRDGIKRPRKKNLPSVTPAPPPAPTATTLSFAALLTSAAGSSGTNQSTAEKPNKRRKSSKNTKTAIMVE